MTQVSLIKKKSRAFNLYKQYRFKEALEVFK